MLHHRVWVNESYVWWISSTFYNLILECNKIQIWYEIIDLVSVIFCFWITNLDSGIFWSFVIATLPYTYVKCHNTEDDSNTYDIPDMIWVFQECAILVKEVYFCVQLSTRITL